MKKIPLTQGQSALVDDEDFEMLSQWKWYALKQPNTFYAVRDIKTNGKKKSIWMHRLINNTPEGYFTDHIDGDGLNNTRSNLRTVTHQDNMINCQRHKIGSSKYRGVSWHIRNENWLAQITVNKKNVYLGAYKIELEAKHAYEEFRLKVRSNQIIKE